MSAKEYYYELLKTHGYSLADIQQMKEKARQRISNSPDWNHLDKETKDQMLQAAGPNLGLQSLLGDALKAVPQKYQPVPSDIVVAEFPLRNINARTIRAPDGGVLILLNGGLIESIREWAKIVANVAIARGAHDLTADAPLAKLTDEFVDSVQNYRREGTLPSFPAYATDDNKRFLSGYLGAAAVEFVIAHEYAHYALGHLAHDPDEVEDRSSKEFWERETECDRAAAEILFNDPPGVTRSINRDFRILGVWYALGVFTMINPSPQDGSGGQSWMQAMQRFGKMTEYIETNVGIQSPGVPNDIASAMDYLLSAIGSDSCKQIGSAPFDAREHSFWLAYRSNDTVAMEAIVRSDPSWGVAWERTLLNGAMALVKFNAESSAGPWDDCTYLDAADTFALALELNSVYEHVYGRPTYKGIGSFGVQLASALETSATDPKLSLPSAARQKEGTRSRVLHLLHTYFPGTGDS